MADVDMMGLIVKLEAQQTQFQRDFNRAISIQAKASKQMEQRAKESADKIAKTYESAGGRISNAFKTIAMPKIAGLMGTVAGIGVAGGVAIVRNQVKDMAELANEAKRAGIGIEAFQEWKFVAEQNRIGIDALTDGFKELHIRAGEFFLDGSGAGAEAFKKLGYSAEELKEKLKDPSNLMVEILGRLSKLDQASQSFLLEEIFGGAGGEQFSALLGKGEAGLRAQIARARDLGLVLDNGAIRKAGELDAKFREVETRLQTMWRTGVVEAGYFFGLIDREKAKLDFDPDTVARLFKRETADSLGDLPEVPQDALAEIEGLRLEYAALAGEARMLVPALSDASNMMRGLGNEAGATALTDLASRIGDAARAFDEGTITGEEYAARLREVVTEAQNSLAAMGELDRARLAGVIGQVQALLDWIGQLPGAAAAARDAVASIALMDTGTGLRPDDPNLLPPEPVSPLAPTTSPRPKPAPVGIGGVDWGRDTSGGKGKGAGGGGGGRSQDEFAQAIEGLNRERQALEAEAAALIVAAQAGMEYADAIEFARVRADLLVAAQRDGRAITPELTAEIDRLAQAHVRAGNAAQKAADDLQAVEERGRKGAEALSDVFTSVLTGAKSAEEAVADLLLEIAKIQLQKAMTGIFTGTGGAGFLGGLLGFSSGGYTGDGPKLEPAGVVHKGEYVFSKETVQRLGADNLERLHQSARKGYASGGLVGASGKIAKAASGLPVDSGKAPNITLSPTINVNASGGTPEQNGDLARQIAEQTERAMRGLVQQELIKQMRPGGMLR